MFETFSAGKGYLDLSKKLSKKRCVYNNRIHAIRYSKKKATQRNDKERTIQQEYSRKLPGVSQKMQMITTNLG